MSVLVAKADGTEEPFNPEKLVASLVLYRGERCLGGGVADTVDN